MTAVLADGVGGEKLLICNHAIEEYRIHRNTYP